jgi:hypothetical protein
VWRGRGLVAAKVTPGTRFNPWRSDKEPAKERKMIRKMLAALALMLSVSSASAQYFYAVIDVAPDQKAYIKDYILRAKVRPVLTDERISMGSTVPPNIQLLPVPSDWGPSVQRFAYFVSDDRVHFVDPQSRRVMLDVF